MKLPKRFDFEEGVCHGLFYISVEEGWTYLHQDGIVRVGCSAEHKDFITNSIREDYTGYFDTREQANQAYINYIMEITK